MDQEIAARKAIEEAYKAEWTERVRVQRLVEDIKREQASPFVVPAIMDAFAKIAQMSDTAMLKMVQDGGDHQMDCP